MDDLQEAKKDAIAQTRRLAKVWLADTDYQVVRQMEQATLPQADFDALKARRQAVRDACNALEESIAACATIAEINTLVPDREQLCG